MKPFLLLLLLLGLAANAMAQVTYRWQDPKTGQVMFSDKPPPPGAKVLGRSGAPAGEEEGADPNAKLPYAVRRAAQNFPVVLFTSSDCIDSCKNARALLTGRQVPFKERSVTTPEDVADLKALTGGEGLVPVASVGRQTLKGFSADEWNSLLDLAGYPAAGRSQNQ